MKEALPDQQTTQVGPVTAPRARWLVLFLLAFGVLIAFADRTGMGAAIADRHFNAEFRLSSSGRGWLNAVFFWSYGASQVPMGWLVDRYGPKRPYAWFFGLWCLISLLTSRIGILAVLVAARLLIGIAEAVIIPASYRWIRNNFDEQHNGLAIGIFAMGNKFGPALGAPAAAWLIIYYSWRAIFLVLGVLGLSWLLVWLLAAPGDKRGRSYEHKADPGAPRVRLGAILKSPVVWGGMISNFSYGYFTFYAMTWMPAYLVEQRHLSLARSGLYTFFSFAGIALVALAAGWAADRLIARGRDAVLVRKIFCMIGFGGGSTLLLGAFSTSLTAALFWNVLSLSLLGFVTANHLALCRLTLIPKPAVGIVTGFQQLALSLAGGLSAGLSGWLLGIGHGYDLPMEVVFAVLLFGAAGTWILLRPEWSPRLSPVQQSA